MADQIKLDRIEINDSNAKQILKNVPVADLRARGERVAAAAAAMSPSGARFFVDVQQWGARVAIYVTCGNEAAREGEAKNRALTRALDAGR
jgi:hypothetical protein